VTFSHALSTNNYGTAKFIVSATAANGTHTTIGAALTSASSGDTIFIRPGKYTENLTLKAGVNLTAFACDPRTPNVTIIGKMTAASFSGGNCSISNIRLQTNGDNILSISSTPNSSVVNFIDCYLNCTNATGVALSTTASSSVVNFYNCYGDLGTTGIALFTGSAAGNNFSFYNSYFSNSGGSTTSNTCNGSIFFSINCYFSNPITFTSQATTQLINTTISSAGATCLTTVTSGTAVLNSCSLLAATSSCISAGASTIVNAYNTEIDSTNTNAITGAGTFNGSCLTFSNTSAIVNTTTQTKYGTIQGINAGNNPPAGFLGEQIRSFLASASAITLSNATPANVTTISLTPGVWDVSCICGFNGGAIVGGLAFLASISTTSATGGTLGDNLVDTPTISTASSDVILTIPAYRLTLSATTTIYLVSQANFTSGTVKSYGRLSAVRVG
jgi:hypothetical protein